MKEIKGIIVPILTPMHIHTSLYQQRQIGFRHTVRLVWMYSGCW